MQFKSAKAPSGFSWAEEGSVTDRLDSGLAAADSITVNRLVRLANHAPAIASLAYFGEISMAMGPMSMPALATTLRGVLTRAVGPTTNKAFSVFFATAVTPASFVFLIWPVIAALQAATLAISALRPSAPPMSQSQLSALTLANVCATGWLITSSNSLKGALPLASCLVLPLVPLFSGFPLRTVEPRGVYKLVFQVFSSFTTIASFLALAVELQYGGRLPLVGTLPAEAASLVFLGLTGFVVSLPQRCLAKRVVNVLALTGILTNRVVGSTSALLSLSFIATAAIWAFAVKQLVKSS